MKTSKKNIVEKYNNEIKISYNLKVKGIKINSYNETGKKNVHEIIYQ